MRFHFTGSSLNFVVVCEHTVSRSLDYLVQKCERISFNVVKAEPCCNIFSHFPDIFPLGHTTSQTLLGERERNVLCFKIILDLFNWLKLKRVSEFF